jgi:hypothetical protein
VVCAFVGGGRMLPLLMLAHACGPRPACRASRHQHLRPLVIMHAASSSCACEIARQPLPACTHACMHACMQRGTVSGFDTPATASCLQAEAERKAKEEAAAKVSPAEGRGAVGAACVVRQSTLCRLRCSLCVKARRWPDSGPHGCQRRQNCQINPDFHTVKAYNDRTEAPVWLLLVHLMLWAPRCCVAWCAV